MWRKADISKWHTCNLIIIERYFAQKKARIEKDPTFSLGYGYGTYMT